MAIVNCPECGHDVSDAAVACPNCGRPLQTRPVVERKVVVADVPRDESGVPKWILIPVIAIAALLLVVFLVVMNRESDEAANERVRVGVEADRDSRSTARNTDSTFPDSSTTTVPPMSDVNVDMPDSPTTTIPGSGTTVDPSASKGKVVIDAKITTARSTSPQPVKNEKFYLLDKDLETILREADLEPINGNSLVNSFGLSVLYPDRYGDFNRAALRAINDHIKYAGTTGADGKATLGNVDPDSYYLFGVTKTSNGFAVWSSPVMIRSGENNLELSPVRLNEMNTSE